MFTSPEKSVLLQIAMGKHDKKMKPLIDAAAVQRTGERIAEAVVNGDIKSLRVIGCENKYWVPSDTVPNHRYVVHITANGSSCNCPQKRKCKHILALKRATGIHKCL